MLYQAASTRLVDARDEPARGVRGSVRPVGSEDAVCTFCRIVSGEAEAEIVFGDESAVAFLDRSPLFAGHLLVVPTRHVVTLADLHPDEVGPYFRRVRHLAVHLPELLGAQGTFVANNNVVSQSVAHLQVPVGPRTKGDGLRGFFWPRRRYGEGEAEAVGALLRDGFARSALD
jgi:histidine triad (HIT) family protein